MKKQIAIFMSLIIIMIPVYSSAALSNVEVSGSDEINGFRRRDDITKIKLDATVGDAPPTDEQVVYKDSTTEEQFSCQDMGDGVTSQCRYEGSPNVLPSQKHYFYIVLYTTDFNVEETKEANIIVDDSAPVALFYIEETVIPADQNITIHYTAIDSAYHASQTCVGLEELVFDMSGAMIRSIEGNGCEMEGILSLNLVSEGFILEDYSGEVNISLIAKDRFGLESDIVTRSFNIDQAIPTISNIQVIRRSELTSKYFDVQYIPYFIPYSVTVKSTISDPNSDINMNGIFGDFSDIYPRSVADGIGSYENIPPTSCNNIGHNTYNCTWENVFIRLNSSGNRQVVFKVTDIYGNTAEVGSVMNFKVDQVSPVISSVVSEFNSGKNYLKYGENRISAIFNEEGSMADGHAWLDASAFGTSSQEVPVDCFRKSSSQWQCDWIIDAIGNDGFVRPISLTGVVSDDFGNLVDLSDNNIVLFEMDTNPPEIMNYTIRSAGSHEFDHTIAGDYLLIEMNLLDHSVIDTAKVNLSEFILHSNLDIAECQIIEETNKNLIKCNWNPSEAIDAEPIEEAYMEFNITDIVGNSLLFEPNPITILDYSNISTNFWNIGGLNIMPNPVDREITPLIQTQVYVSVPFNGNVEMLDLSLEGCNGHNVTINNELSTTSSADYISNIEVLNTESLDEPNPFIVMTLIAEELKLDSLKYTCVFKSVSRQGLFVFPPEYDNVTFEIELYNNPLGDIEDSVQEEIDETIDSIDSGLLKTLGLLEKVRKWADMACKLRAMWESGSLLWQIVTQTVTAANQATGTTWLEAARIKICTQSSTIRDETTNVATTGFQKFCWYMNCQIGPLPDSKPQTDEGASLEGFISNDKTWASSMRGAYDNPIGVDTMSDSVADALGFGTSGTDKIPASQYLNVKDNLFLSLVFQCLPGVIYNVNKYRNIQCLYLDCLENQVPKGVPLSVCTDIKGHAECMFLGTQIMGAAPQTAFIDYVLKQLKKIFSDPVTTVAFFIQYVGKCGQLCAPDRSGVAQGTCIWVKIIGMLASAVSNVDSMISGDVWEVEEDYCALIDH